MKKDLKRQIITALAVTAVLGAAGGITAQATDEKHILVSSDEANTIGQSGESYAYGVIGGTAYADKGLTTTVPRILALVSTNETQIVEAVINKFTPVDQDKPKVNIEESAGVTLENKANKNPTVVRYYGVVGGDLSVNAGLTNGNEDKNTNGFQVNILGSEYNLLEESPAETEIVRKGDVTNTITGGSVIGGIGGSAAAALGNVTASGKTDISYKTTPLGSLTANMALDGTARTTVDGNVSTAISDNTNVLGWMNGGLAAGIGGTASSTVTGNTEITIAGKDAQGSVNDGQDAIPQITDVLNWMNEKQVSAIGVTGGGAAVTTLGGTADAVVGGSTKINVNDATVIGVIGGGAAASVDATGVAEAVLNDDKPYGNDDGSVDITSAQLGDLLKDKIPDVSLTGDLTITATDAIDGGTATSKTGDTNISLTGKTTAAGVFGGGAAAAYHTYQLKADKENVGKLGNEYGSSTAAAETGKSKIDIALNNDGKAIGVFGGGAAFAYSETGNGVADGSGASAAATTNGSEITVIGNGDMKDHVGGLFGGGAAVAFNWAKATAEMTDTVDITIANADVSGVVGGGLAYFTGTSPAGGNNLRGMATAAAKDTTINVMDEKSTVAGILGGGIAIDDSQADWTNAKAETTGTATINVNGGTVTKVDVSGLQDALKKLDEKLNNPDGDNPNYKPNDVIEYIGGITNAAGNAAIAAGGVALSDGAVADVANAVVNINGGTVDGNIYGGGIAAYGYSVTEEGENGQQVTKPVGGSHVGTSTINLNGGTVTGNVYAGGAVSSQNKAGKPDNNTEYMHATATVDTAVINLAGTTVDGILYGTGTVDGKANGTSATASSTVKESTLNLIGKNELGLAGETGSKSSKIQDFTNVVAKAGSETVVTDKDTENTALISGGKVTVEDGALLNIKDLATGFEEEGTTGKTYKIAADTADASTFWDDSDLIYDRMNGVYAKTEVTDGEGGDSDTSFSITYDKIDTTEEANAAADSMTDALGVKDLRGMFREGMNDGWKKLDKDSGAGKYLDDWQMADNKTPYQRGMLFGEDAAVTGNTVSIARAMADNVTQRLSFTDDYVQEQGWANQDGGVWAKYMHRKYETDGMSSSVGGIHSGTDYDGILVGMDLAKNGKFQSGVAIHYGSGEGDGLISHNDYDAWGITLYGSLKDEEAGTNLMADIGWMTSDNDIDGTVAGRRMSANRDVDAWTIGIRGEKEFVSGKNQIVPYAGLRYMSVNPGSYTTYYDGQAAFHNDAENQDLWLLPIGVSFRNETVTSSGWRITPKLDLSYIWAFGDTDTDMTVNADGYTGSLYYDVMDDSSWLATLGVEAEKDAWTFGINYGYQKGDDTKNKTWYVTAGYSF